jgi:hypothetical protein
MSVETDISPQKRSRLPGLSVIVHRHWRQNTMSTRELVAPIPSSRTVQGRPVSEKNSDTGIHLCSPVSVVVHLGWGQRRGQTDVKE